MHYIYTLIDPRDNQVRYVGHSTNPATRLNQHIGGCPNVLKGKDEWLEELFQANLVPALKIVDKAETKTEARAKEAHWILHYLTNGAKLVNGEVLWAEPGSSSFSSYLARLRIRASQQIQAQIVEQQQSLITGISTEEEQEA